MKIGLFFQEITFITEFPGSNFLLPTFLAGSKWDFPVANLLLRTLIRWEFFPSKNNPKNLDSSYKMGLDLWDCLGKVKLLL